MLQRANEPQTPVPSQCLHHSEANGGRFRIPKCAVKCTESKRNTGGPWRYLASHRRSEDAARLGLITSGKGRINNGLASKRVADVRAFGPTIRKLRKTGFVSINAIARELNEREISTARGGKWHLTCVSRLLRRLDFSSDRGR